MSPESLVQRIYSEKTDVWSFGIIMVEIITRKDDPYPELDAVQVATRVGMKDLSPSLPKFTTPFFHSLLSQCCDQDPKKRPTFAQIVSLVQQNTPKSKNPYNQHSV